MNALRISAFQIFISNNRSSKKLTNLLKLFSSWKKVRIILETDENRFLKKSNLFFLMPIRQHLLPAYPCSLASPNQIFKFCPPVNFRLITFIQCSRQIVSNDCAKVRNRKNRIITNKNRSFIEKQLVIYQYRRVSFAYKMFLANTNSV